MDSQESKAPSSEESDCSNNAAPLDTYHMNLRKNVCPDCTAKLYWSGGCPFCPFCGWSRCN